MGHEHEEAVRLPSVWHPRDVAEAWTFKRLMGADAIYVAGSTLLRTQWESGVSSMPGNLINLCGIPGLSGITVDEDFITIGALTTLGECRENSLLREHHPILADAIRSIAATSVRNLATIGGNVNSKVGDCLPALIACRAELEWCTGLGSMTEPASEWVELLHLQSPKPSNILMNIRLPLNRTARTPAAYGAYHKVGRREAFTPSVVTLAWSGCAKPDGAVKETIIAVAGGQTIAQRMYKAERALKGQQITRELLLEVHRLIESEFVPKTDPLISDGYRRRTAANLVIADLWKAFADKEGGAM